MGVTYFLADPQELEGWKVAEEELNAIQDEVEELIARRYQQLSERLAIQPNFESGRQYDLFSAAPTIGHHSFGNPFDWHLTRDETIEGVERGLVIVGRHDLEVISIGDFLAMVGSPVPPPHSA